MGMPFESKRYKGRRECKTEGTENELLEETPCRREVQRPITNPRISARESKAPNRYGEYIMYRGCSTKKYYRLHALDVVWLDQGPYTCMYYSVEHRLSFSQMFCEFESNSTSDKLKASDFLLLSDASKTTTTITTPTTNPILCEIDTETACKVAILN